MSWPGIMKMAALVHLGAFQLPESAQVPNEQTTSGPAVMTAGEYFKNELRADVSYISGASGGIVGGRLELWYKPAMVISGGTWQYDVSKFIIHNDHRWLRCGDGNRTSLTFVQHGGAILLLAKPELSRRSSQIVHSTAPLETALPTAEDLRAGRRNVKPRSYEGMTLGHQPLCVTGQADTQAYALRFGANAVGSTELYFAPAPVGEDSVQSLAGVPGTTWLLPATTLVAAGAVQVSGVRLRVLTKDYIWRDSKGKRETIPRVLHVEAERVDADVPARIVYRLENDRLLRFELCEPLGAFVYSDLRSRGGVLVESRGWKQVPP